MLRCGVDVIEISRIAEVVGRHGDRFLVRRFTQGEINYCKGNVYSIAVRWAAKEAVMKALGLDPREVHFTDIEVISPSGKKPQIRLHGRASEEVVKLGLTEFDLSLTHSKENAIAFFVSQ